MLAGRLYPGRCPHAGLCHLQRARIDRYVDIRGHHGYTFEWWLARGHTGRLVSLRAALDGSLLNNYRADGLIVATPTGSTAYSLSSGGPIVSPGSENILITPLAPHNLTIRPIVISDKSEISIRVEGRDSEYLVSLDSKTDVIEPGLELRIRKADFSFNLVKIEHKDFYTTIRDKLKWGLDVRN